MNPFDVKRKALGAVRSFGKAGMAEHLKKGYGPKPAVSISIEAVKAKPLDEESEGEGMLSERMLAKHEGMEPEAVKTAEGDMGEADLAEAMASKKAEPPSEITPEILEMLLSKLKQA